MTILDASEAVDLSGRTELADGEARIRIAFVISDLRRAGAEKQLVMLATALDPARYQIDILLLKETNAFEAELRGSAITTHALKRRGPSDVGVVWRLYRALRRLQPNIVHSYLFFANVLSVLAARAAGVPTVIVSQRCSYEATLPGFWRRLARLSHRLADRVVVNSRAVLHEERAAGLPETLLVCIPNGILPPSTTSAATRPLLGLPDGLLAVSVGQFTPEKGYGSLIRAWAIVSGAQPDARLILVGDGPLRASLEREARQLGLGDRVLFVGFRHPVEPYLAAADLVVSSSISEGMPNAILEAMVLGRAAVVTSAGGLPELVVDGVTGHVVPPGDAAALAHALTGLLADPALRERFGAAARERAHVHFSVERMVDATEAVYAAPRR